jgi:hypothetical protein
MIGDEIDRLLQAVEQLGVDRARVRHGSLLRCDCDPAVSARRA